MVCKVFFAKNFRKKAGNRETNCPECFLRTQCRANAAKAQKKADFSQHFRGSRKVQTFRVKNAVSGPDLLPAKLLGALHNRGKKLRIPVLCKGEQQLINGGLRLPLRALLGQRECGGKHLQFEGADRFRCSPQADKIVIVRVAAGHGTGGAARGNAVLFSLDDGKHPLQPFLRCIRLRGKAQPGVQNLVGVVRFGLAGGGPGKPHEGTEKSISCLLSRGDRRF